MNQVLILDKNLNKALTSYPINKWDRIIYSPIYQSEVQKKFCNEVFSNLYNFNQSIEFRPNVKIDDQNNTKFFIASWDCYEERKRFDFKNFQFIVHNSLIDQFNFSNKTFFTSFRREVEEIIPNHFNEAIQIEFKSVVEKLNSYFSSNAPSTYFETRNQLFGDDFSTKFSALLSHGLLDVKYLWNQVSKYEEDKVKNKSTYWIKFELLWRDFFYHSYQFYKNRIFSKNGHKGKLDFERISLDEAKIMKSAYHTPYILSALKELTKTGYLSNRMRQIFASFLINDLNLDWREGALLFEKYLIDFDVYSNQGNWQYLAGIGHDPLGKRYFNIEKQIKQYDPLKKYLTLWA